VPKNPMRLLLSAVRYFDRQPRPLILLLASGVLAGLALVDSLAGPGVRLGWFYLVPASFAAWHAGSRWGVGLASLGAALGFVAEPSAGDALVRFGVFLLVIALLSVLRRAQDEEASRARTDALTGAANRRWFREQLDREILRCKRYRRPFTVIYGDLDRFKALNDRLGHLAGDALLREVSDVMRRGVRTTDLVARLGGDEFAILLPETEQTAAGVVARELRERVLEAMRRRGWPVGMSLGVVTCLDPPADADTLLGLADELMYAAKRQPGGGVRHTVASWPPG